MSRKLHIGLSLSPTWLRGSAWRDTDSGVEHLLSPRFAIELAQHAERAKLDFLFKPDSLFIEPKGLEHAPGMTSLDPIVQLAGLAQSTSHIGLVATASTTFVPPFIVARQLQSLHWLSDGRAGWNIVTALDGERNFGIPAMPSAEWRYERAAEFVEVVQKLWRSYPADAIKREREAGQFADSQTVSAINHHGKHFTVEGPLTLPMHSAGPPPLFQAGASPTGRDFAASLATGIFASTPDKAAAIALRQDLRERAQRFGRLPSHIKLMPGLGLLLSKNRSEAQDRFRERQRGLDLEPRYRFIENSLGVDIRALPLNAPIPERLVTGINPNARSRTHAALLLRLIQTENPTIAQLLARPEASGSGHWQVVGTPLDAADAICDWFAAGALDGIIALPASLPSLRLFLDETVPVLVERDIFRKDYTGTTLAQHLGLS